VALIPVRRKGREGGEREGEREREKERERERERENQALGGFVVTSDELRFN